MRLKCFQIVKNNKRTIFDLVCKLNWLFIVIFSFLTKLAITFQTNPYILPLKWSAREPGSPMQQPRDLVRGTVSIHFSFSICHFIFSHF